MEDKHDRQGNDTGEELYRLLLDGDKDALAELFEMYKVSMTLFINGFIGDMDESEALMLDAFTALVMGKKRFAGRSSFKTYLFGIAKKLALRHLRKNKPHISLDEAGDALIDEHTPEAALLGDERNRQLYIAMRRLKQEHREVLHLIYFENMGYADVGAVLKKTERQIAGLAYRARIALRRRLELGGFVYEDV